MYNFTTRLSVFFNRVFRGVFAEWEKERKIKSKEGNFGEYFIFLKRFHFLKDFFFCICVCCFVGFVLVVGLIFLDGDRQIWGLFEVQAGNRGRPRSAWEVQYWGWRLYRRRPTGWACLTWTRRARAARRPRPLTLYQRPGRGLPGRRDYFCYLDLMMIRLHWHY